MNELFERGNFFRFFLRETISNFDKWDLFFFSTIFDR